MYNQTNHTWFYDTQMPGHRAERVDQYASENGDTVTGVVIEALG